MDCEICGRQDGGILAIIEGAKLYVCPGCSRGGKIISVPQPPAKKQLASTPSFGAGARTELEVVDDYGRTIRAAREKMGLPLSVLAERISEKESYLDRIEKESAKPAETVAKKLEHELGIRLLEQVTVQHYDYSDKSGKGTTLGDILEVEKRKKK